MLAEPAKWAVLKRLSKGRYGGRVQRGMKKSFSEGMVTLLVVLAL
jgi:hypothetical protein